MNRPTVLHVEDEDRIEALRKRTGAASTLAVIRRALDLLERDLTEPGDVFGTTSEEVLFDLHDDTGSA